MTSSSNTSPPVLCLGEILFDRIADQMSDSSGAVQSWTNYPGGAPANVACGLSKLGTRAGFIGSVGSDPLAQDLINLLQTHNVNIDGVQHIANYPTRTVMVLRDRQGERTFAGFTQDKSTNDFADTRLNVDHLPRHLFTTAQFLVLGTLSLATPKSHTAVIRSIELAKQANCKVLLDINWRPVFWPNPQSALPQILRLIEQADFLKLSEEESHWLFGHISVNSIAKQFPNLQGIFLTQGKGGCHYRLQQYQGHIPAFSVHAVDTTGAGDGFVAGLLHQFCLIPPNEVIDAITSQQMVTYATAVGGLATTRPGAISAQPTAAQVDQLLATQR